MQLFYAPNIAPEGYTLSEEESKHCVRVLRMSQGDRLHITDGCGRLYLCQIEDPNPKRCRLSILSYEQELESFPYELCMAVAPTKNSDRFEWFLEKATEIGVSSFVPIKSAHSERKTLNIERSGRVITSAMKQSLKFYHPRLEALCPFSEFISRYSKDDDFDKFIAHCNDSEEKMPLFDLLKPGAKTVVLIGPEGDFSPEEVALARQSGFREISLGKQRLRTETAALYAVTAVALKQV